MTRIKTYAIDSFISENDIVIGSDYENSGVTKNYTFKDIITFLDGKVGGGVVVDGVSIDLSSKANVYGQIFTGEIYAPNLTGENTGDQVLPTILSLELDNVDNTSDLNKPVSIATQIALNGKEDKSNKNISNGYAGLGSDGKIISSQLPALVVSDTYFATSDAAMTALTNATTGDICIRTDLSKTYILRGSNYTVLNDWTELLSPTGGATSVFGRTGTVIANANDYDSSQISETSTRVFQTPTQKTNNDATSSIQTQLNNKVDKVIGSRLITSTEATIIANISSSSANYIQASPATVQIASINVSGSGTFDSGLNINGGYVSSFIKNDSSTFTLGTIAPHSLTLKTNNLVRLLISSGGQAVFSSNVTAQSFYQSSDLRLKDIVSRDGNMIKFTWKDKRDELIHVGYIAQEIQKINPDQVNTDKNGMLSVNYIEVLVQKIQDLENRIKQLEK